MQEEIPEQAQVPKQRMTRKEARAARIAAEQAEEEEEIHLRDPAQAAQACKRRARGLSARAMIVLILAAAAAYLSLAPSFDVLPLPVILDVVENPAMGIGALMLLQFIALFIGVDVFGKGFYNLLHGMPDRCSLVSLRCWRHCCTGHPSLCLTIRRVSMCVSCGQHPAAVCSDA